MVFLTILAIFARDCLTKFSAELFSLRKLGREFANQIFLDISQFFLYSSFPTATPYHINCQTRQGKVIPYHSLIRLRHRKGKCALTLTYVEYYVYTKSHTHIARYLNVVQRDVLHRFFLNIWLSWNVRTGTTVNNYYRVTQIVF